MPRLLMICPTRNRPDKVMDMLASFKKTRTFADIVFYVACDDPRYDEYVLNLTDENVVYGDRLPIVSIFNLLSQNDGYDYFGDINDDHIFHTEGWDRIFVDAIETRGQGWGIAFGTEKNTPAEQPSGMAISAKCISALGYYINPIFEHLFIDWYIREVYKPLGLLLKCPEVHIEHKHWTFGKADIDQNYKELYQNENNYKRQENIYHKWYNENRIAEIEILRTAIRDSQDAL